MKNKILQIFYKYSTNNLQEYLLLTSNDYDYDKVL